MILSAIEKAYKQAKLKGWDKIYWAIDLHGTCLKSNYDSYKFELVNDMVIPTLKLIQSLPESVLIMWSSGYRTDLDNARAFFEDRGVYFKYININPEVDNTKTGNFKKKMYFSIGLDDKFGFNPDYDWSSIAWELSKKPKWLIL